MTSFCKVNLNFYLNSIKYYFHQEKCKGGFSSFFFKVSSLLKNKKKQKTPNIENPYEHGCV